MTNRPTEQPTPNPTPAETEIPIDPDWTPSYQKARRLGKKLMYVCRQGEERSPILAKHGCQVGETETVFLTSGILGLKAEEDADKKLVELLSGNYLRIVRDIYDFNTPEYVWLQDRLTALEQAGSIAHGSYEFTTLENGAQGYFQQEIKILQKQKEAATK